MAVLVSNVHITAPNLERLICANPNFFAVLALWCAALRAGFMDEGDLKPPFMKLVRKVGNFPLMAKLSPAMFWAS